eukprot:15279882-Heterocapsa_arctica.AAC.1
MVTDQAATIAAQSSAIHDQAATLATQSVHINDIKTALQSSEHRFNEMMQVLTAGFKNAETNVEATFGRVQAASEQRIASGEAKMADVMTAMAIAVSAQGDTLQEMRVGMQTISAQQAALQATTAQPTTAAATQPGTFDPWARAAAA